MSMISQIFGISQTPQVNGGKDTSQTNADVKGQEALSRLSGGDTVDGKIADIKGNDVTIELPGGGTVTAKLENAMALSKGQTVTFEVRASSGNQVSLTPLYTNMNLSATAQKALQAAGMAVNADSLKMAVSMMDEGLGIDKNSLGDMYNRILSHSDADIRDLVEMTRIGLPMDEESIAQYSAFKNYENQISDGMREIADSAVSLYEELNGTEGETQAVHFLRELTDIIVKGDAAEKEVVSDVTANENTAEIGAQGGESVHEAVPKSIIPGAGSENMIPEMPETISESFVAETEQVFAGLLGKAEEDGDPAAGIGKTVPDRAEMKNTEAGAAAQNAVNEDLNVETESLRQSISGSAETIRQSDSAAAGVRNALAAAALSAGEPALAERLMGTEPADRNVLKVANAVLKALDGSNVKNEGLAERLRAILDSSDFKDVVKNTLKENWMLRPEQVGDKTNVENLYQRLNTQTKELTQMLTQIAKPESAMAQNLGNMSNNLDFMNQMNQMYQYVQLPLKMNGSEATGDLFVYSDKKSLAAKDGNVSALLHLDMKYLGALDVYAAIAQGNKVSTRFYLESDEMIDFIAEHIHILNEHLEARGYQVKADITKHDDTSGDDPDGEKQVRKLKETVGKSLLSKRSFDVRA